MALTGCQQAYKLSLYDDPTLRSTDTFTISRTQKTEQKATDVLFVIDNSGSMGDDQAELKSNFSDFVDNGLSKLGDACIGVTTSDAYRTGENTNATLSSSRKVCTKGLTQEQIKTQSNIALDVGINGSGDERIFTSLQTFLQISGQNFFRSGPDTMAVVVLITDEVEQSRSLTGTKESAQKVKNDLDAFFGTRPYFVVSVSYVADPELMAITDLVGNGSFYRTLRTDSFGDILNSIADTVTTQESGSQFTLSSDPSLGTLSIQLQLLEGGRVVKQITLAPGQYSLTGTTVEIFPETIAGLASSDIYEILVSIHYLPKKYE